MCLTTLIVSLVHTHLKSRDRHVFYPPHQVVPLVGLNFVSTSLPPIQCNGGCLGKIFCEDGSKDLAGDLECSTYLVRGRGDSIRFLGVLRWLPYANT